MRASTTYNIDGNEHAQQAPHDSGQCAAACLIAGLGFNVLVALVKKDNCCHGTRSAQGDGDWYRYQVGSCL